MRPILLRASSVGLFVVLAPVALTVAACGARTGLPAPEPSTCVSLDTEVPLADLDVFLMLDSSSSMEATTAQGITKWASVRAAIEAFVQSPASVGLGATIGFFPITDESVPLVCSSDVTCGLLDACRPINVCIPGSLTQCDTAQDCADNGFPDDVCEPLGLCSNDTEAACLPALGIECASGSGPCIDAGLCENRYACGDSKYSEQIADVERLPEAASSVLAAIDARTPAGGTTTLPALRGTIDRAVGWTKANPGHKAIVLLATDGLPTLCDPALDSDTPELGITHVAEAAAAGVASGVQTFVIGVFEPDEAEEAAANLNAIAAGGGTESAYLVSTDEDVTELFLETLEQVRLAAKSCEFAIPQVEGKLPDLATMKVLVTPAGGGEPVSVPLRASAAGCDPKAGGFFYDVPIGGEIAPSRVILCPASCALFGDDIERTVKLEASCDE